ncbi:LysR family transcriptional regulator [Microbacterium sp. LWO13-1.2]|uniref:LysR family transcriptional regulator n=1 Tax=unclassified Microbacterium TaxID=2609290 RepID=UPI00313A3BD7
MNTDDLRILLELSRTGRLNAVAGRMQLDETTVSRRLARLEQSVGSRLIDRGRHGWQLTAAGEILIPHAEAIENARLAAVDELSTSRQTLSGAIRVLAPDGFGVYVLIPGLADLRDQHPDLTLEISTATSQGAVTARDFDVAISLEPSSVPTVRAAPLAEYELRLYASADYLRRNGEPSSTRDVIDGHSVIWYIDSMLDVRPLRLLDTILAGAHARVQCNNITGQVQAAINGLGIAPLPTFIGEREPRLVPVLPESFAVKRAYWMIAPEIGLPLRRVQATIEAVRALVDKHPDLDLLPRADGAPG